MNHLCYAVKSSIRPGYLDCCVMARTSEKYILEQMELQKTDAKRSKQNINFLIDISGSMGMGCSVPMRDGSVLDPSSIQPPLSATQTYNSFAPPLSSSSALQSSGLLDQTSLSSSIQPPLSATQLNPFAAFLNSANPEQFGSEHKTRLDVAKESVISILELVKIARLTNLKFTLIAFNHDVDLVFEKETVTEHNFEELVSKIGGLFPHGSTYFKAPLDNVLRYTDDDSLTIVLSDGEDTSSTSHDLIQESSHGLRGEVYFVGIGEYDRSMMMKLTKSSNSIFEGFDSEDIKNSLSAPVLGNIVSLGEISVKIPGAQELISNLGSKFKLRPQTTAYWYFSLPESSGSIIIDYSITQCNPKTVEIPIHLLEKTENISLIEKVQYFIQTSIGFPEACSRFSEDKDLDSFESSIEHYFKIMNSFSHTKCEDSDSEIVALFLEQCKDLAKIIQKRRADVTSLRLQAEGIGLTHQQELFTSMGGIWCSDATNRTRFASSSATSTMTNLATSMAPSSIASQQCECVLCLNTIPENSKCLLKCGHTFCKQCVVTWTSDFINKTTRAPCPSCREPISVKGFIDQRRIGCSHTEETGGTEVHCTQKIKFFAFPCMHADMCGKHLSAYIGKKCPRQGCQTYIKKIGKFFD